jgi:hypothetical protein
LIVAVSPSAVHKPRLSSAHVALAKIKEKDATVGVDARERAAVARLDALDVDVPLALGRALVPQFSSAGGESGKEDGAYVAAGTVELAVVVGVEVDDLGAQPVVRKCEIRSLARG